MDWLSNDLPTPPKEKPKRSRLPLIIGIAALGTLLAASLILVAVLYRPQSPTPTPTPTATRAEPVPTKDEATTSSTPKPTPTQTLAAGTGSDTAQAWLRAYLNRDPRMSTQWRLAIKPLSDPALVEALAGQTADQIGLADLASWAVTDLKPIVVPAQGADTPTRSITSWAVSISDGKVTKNKPFTVTAYHGDKGWLVADVKQLLSSEG